MDGNCEMDAERLLYIDHIVDIDARVAGLISRRSPEEKVSRVLHNSTPVPRLNVPEYNWWSESLHGVALGEIATVFPRVIGTLNVSR